MWPVLPSFENLLFSIDMQVARSFWPLGSAHINLDSPKPITAQVTMLIFIIKWENPSLNLVAEKFVGARGRKLGIKRIILQ